MRPAHRRPGNRLAALVVTAGATISAVSGVLGWTGAAATLTNDEPRASSHHHPRAVVLAPGYSDLRFQPPAPGSYRLPPLGKAADGQVVDAAGRSGTLHDLMGDRIVLLSFIYTRCSDVNGCPLATFVMKEVQNRVLAEPTLKNRIRLLSMSFDPAYDTPEVLTRYAEHFRAVDFDWRFLTAPTESALTGTLQNYGQWIIRDYDDQGAYLGTVSHLLRVYLIDRHRRIRNIYSTTFLHADTVVNDVRTLLLEGN